MTGPHDSLPPSAWVIRWADRVAAGGRVLDVACGHGRHARYFAGRGHPVTAVDRDPGAIAALSGVHGISATCSDLEGGAWPYPGRSFHGVIVTNYLFRPLFPYLLAAVGPGGALIYETFAVGNERYGRPANPEFLLRAGELLDVTRGILDVVAFEQLYVAEPKPAMVQRICAVRSDKAGE